MWNNENITSGLQGFLMAALTRALGWQKEEVDVLAAQARNDVNNLRIHTYWPVYVVALITFQRLFLPCHAY